MEQLDIIRFAERFFVLEDGKPIKFEPWQKKEILKPVFYDLDKKGNRKINQTLLGMPKKNGKSTLAACVACHALFADGEVGAEVYSAAGDKDQARIIFDYTRKAIERSPMLRNECKVYKGGVIEVPKTGGIYRALSSDAPSVHGLNASLVVYDELWNQRNYDLWEALTHSPARTQPLHFVITYAGMDPYKGNLLWDLYQAGLNGKDPAFYMYWSNENKASWVSGKYLAQQERRLPEHIFKRLHRNEWTTGFASFLTREDIDRAIDPDLEQKDRLDGNLAPAFVALDLGLRRDRTAIVVTHNEEGVVILDHVKTFKAPKGGEVNVGEVEDYLLYINERFSFPQLIVDPWQSIASMQRLRDKGLAVQEFTFSGSNWTKMTQSLFSLFKDGRIRIFEHEVLVQELLQAKVVEKSYGYRLDHESGAHNDVLVALAMSVQESANPPSPPMVY